MVKPTKPTPAAKSPAPNTTMKKSSMPKRAPVDPAPAVAANRARVVDARRRFEEQQQKSRDQAQRVRARVKRTLIERRIAYADQALGSAEEHLSATLANPDLTDDERAATMQASEYITSARGVLAQLRLGQ